MKNPRVAIVAAAMSFAATPVAAQWQQLPSHDWAYSFDLVTSGTFSCGEERFIRGGTCAAIGNSITFTHDDAALRLTFVGVSRPVTLVTGPLDGTVKVGVGFIEQRLTGTGDFLFPHGPAYGLFSLDVTFVSTLMLDAGPYAASTTKTMRAYVLGDPQSTTQLVGSGPVFMGVAPAPTNIVAVAFDTFNEPVIVPGSGTVAVTANSLLIPEPATLAMVSTGLLGVLGIGACQRHRGPAA